LTGFDHLGAQAFTGFVVRKDLVRRYAKAYPVPAYVVEFLLGRYCASTDEAEIKEGLEIVEKTVERPLRTHRPGRAVQERGVSQGLGPHHRYRTRAARCQKCLLHCRTSEPRATRRAYLGHIVEENERILIDGFYAEVTLAYDSVIAQEKNGRPFGIEALRPIQMSRADVLDTFYDGRAKFETPNDWIDFLLRSVGFEPAEFTSGESRSRFCA